ncbi:MAG: hypothetical protein Q7J80_06350, partial [Anaerolineales bacterium]|nr:hypothetical protein [Anaerolineales bacterium]
QSRENGHSDPCALHGYDSPECRGYLNLPEPPLDDIVQKNDDDAVTTPVTPASAEGSNSCPSAQLAGAGFAVMFGVADVVFGIGTLASGIAAGPFAPIVVAVWLLPDAASLYGTILAVQLMSQGATRSCEDIHIDPNPLNN